MIDHEAPDPLLLLSPGSSVQELEEKPVKSRPVQQIYVSIPRLTDEEKMQYSDMPEEGSVSEPEIVIDEIAGDFRDENKGFFYFARYQDELLRSVRYGLLRREFLHF